jgi:DNA-directed RNA polymerase subunit M/transcription elongation factor TFIIS
MRLGETLFRRSIRKANGNRVIDSRKEPGKQPRAVRVCCTACGELLGVRIGKKSRTINCPECGVELRLPTLREVRKAQQANPDPVELPAESLPAPPRRTKKKKAAEHVTVTCPVCNARLHPTVKQEARKITCPDCYVEVHVPARRDVAESSREPHEPPNPGEYAFQAPRAMPKRRPQLDLASASRELHREKLPAPPRWTFFSGVFNFPWYHGTVFRLTWISLGFTLCGMLLLMVSRLLMAMGGFALVAMGFFLLPLIWFTIWTLSYAAACCMPVLLETAAGADEVRGWPEPNWREWAAELFYFVWLGTVTGLIAWGVAELAAIQTGHFRLPLEISWLVLYPIILLSAMETNSIWRPFSLPLLRTLVSHGRYWLLFYGLVAVLAAFWLVAFDFGSRMSPFLSMLVIGPLSAACVLIYARLVGRLAWKITQVK